MHIASVRNPWACGHTMQKFKLTHHLKIEPRDTPAAKVALAKAAKAEDRSAAYIAQRFIMEGLKTGGFLKGASPPD
jgi:hypothetical protein